jgi:hypothetical protein
MFRPEDRRKRPAKRSEGIAARLVVCFVSFSVLKMEAVYSVETFGKILHNYTATHVM